MKELRYEKAIAQTELDLRADNHPMFVNSCALILHILRARRPPATLLSLRLMKMAQIQLSYDQITACRVLLLAAMAVSHDQIFQSLMAWSHKELAACLEELKNLPPGLKAAQGKLQIPKEVLASLPPQIAAEFARVIGEIDVEQLQQGKTVFKTKSGSFEIVKMPFDSSVDPRRN